MKQIRADRGALGEGCVVINEGPDAYVMEDNRIRLEPGEALACVAASEIWQTGGSILYKMSREEAERWSRDHLVPPHPKPDDKLPRKLYRAYTEGTHYRAPIRFIKEDLDMSEGLRTSHRTNFIGHQI